MDAYRINPEHCFVIPNGVRLQIYLQQDLEYLEVYRNDIEVKLLGLQQIVFLFLTLSG
jgi:hypothetical protein